MLWIQRPQYLIRPLSDQETFLPSMLVATHGKKVAPVSLGSVLFDVDPRANGFSSGFIVHRRWETQNLRGLNIDQLLYNNYHVYYMEKKYNKSLQSSVQYTDKKDL